MPHNPLFPEALACSRSHGRLSENPSAWDGLIGCWTMLQGGGSTLYDVSGHGNHGALTNMTPATDWIVSEEGYALDFSAGDTRAVEVGDISTTVFGGDATLTALVRLTNDGDAQSFLFDKRATGGNGHLTYSASGVVTSVWDSTFISQGTFTENVWQYLTIWRKGSVVRHFIDGVQVGSDGATGNDASNTNQAVIASRSFTSRASSWEGEIASLAVYDRAVALSEIQRMHVDPNAMFRLRRQYVVKAPALGGLNIPVAIHHYQMAGGL